MPTLFIVDLFWVTWICGKIPTIFKLGKFVLVLCHISVRGTIIMLFFSFGFISYE